jgi:hypothetical protein
VKSRMHPVPDFGSDPSQQFTEAVSALRCLAEHDPKLARRAYAKASAEAWWAFFVKVWRPRRVPGHVCLRRLLGRRCGSGASKSLPCAKVPGAEHIGLWVVNGPWRGRVLIAQPYGLDHTDTVKLAEFCRRWGLLCEIRPGTSWYSPGDSLLLLVYQDHPERRKRVVWG